MFATAALLACLVVGCLIVEAVRRSLDEVLNHHEDKEQTMCDIASMQIAEEVIQDQVKAGAMFTAYDVSREARARGSAERHRDLKQVTHAAFARGEMGADYTRTLIRIPGVKAPAWLYHRTQDDPQSYGAAQGQPPTRPGRAVDGRLRLCVPSRPLRHAGFTPGDSVWITADPQQQCVVLTRKKPGAKVLATYHVERTGNIRIGPRVFRKAGLASRTFTILDDGNTVTVKPI